MIQDVKTDEWQLFDIRGIRQVNRWQPLIPLENTVYVAFNEDTIKHFSHIDQENIFGYK